ncbi:unnamed protein product [Calypogeia fissa]
MNILRNWRRNRKNELHFQMAKASLTTAALVGAAWLWDETSPLGWWTLKPRTKEEREMANLYQRREYPYPGDKEAVKEFVEKGGTYGTAIGSQSALKESGNSILLDMQREKFERESHKLWLRMQREVLQDFEERGYTPTTSTSA